MAFAFLVILWLLEGAMALFCLYRFSQFLGSAGGGRATRSMLTLAGVIVGTIALSMALHGDGWVWAAVLVAAWPLLPVFGYGLFLAVALLSSKGRWN